MKKSLLAVLSLALLMMLVFPSFAWYVPSTNSSNDLYNTWGPRVDNVLCVIHTSQEGEYNSFKSKLIDIFDWPFTIEQKNELDSSDPSMNEYERVFFAEWGMFEVDINNQVFPGDDVNFRTALSKLINKDTFVSTTLGGLAQAAHSPLWHNVVWRYEPCESFTSEIYAPTAAYQMLYDNGYRDWDSDGIVEYSSDGGIHKREFTIKLFGRSEDPKRTALANLANNVLTTGAEASILGAKFNVNLQIVPRATCYQKVMIEYDYTLYTGGWSFGRDPDTIYFLFHSKFATKPDPWANNYINYRSTEFDAALEKMIGAGDFETAHYWCNQSQSIFMSDVAFIPMWNTAGYSGFLSNVEHAIPMSGYQAGTSVAAYETLMNAYLTGNPYGGTLRWGFMNDFSALSVYMSQWVWDWNILQELYDSLIGYNPYDFTEDYGVMAESWDVGNWTYLGDTCTKVTFHLRHDMYWHDIPPKADRAYGIAPQGTGALHVDSLGHPDPQPPIPVTADDVVFTIMYIGESSDAWNWGTVCDVAYVDAPDPYTATVYYFTYMPIWALHWCGGLPIMPKFIWGKVPVAEAGDYDPLTEKTLSGSGPFTFNYTAYVPHQYVRLDKYDRYHMLSPANVYVDADGTLVTPGSSINFTVKVANRDAENTIVGNLTIKVDGVTKDTINGISLDPKEEYVTPTTYNTGALAKGYHNITAFFDITSPIQFANMDKTYVHKIWVTIPEDLNLDIYVGIDDIVYCAEHFGGQPRPLPGAIRWDYRCDLNGDLYIGIDDIVNIAEDFGKP
jgi:ABC-type transport system substrate-binding protein